jgi:hypothetical protein
MGYKHPDSKSKYDAEYRKRPYVIEKAIEYKRKNAERFGTKEFKMKARWSYIIRNYGLEKVDFESMLEEQQNKCAICGLEFHDESKSTRPHIDHCHNSGDVRGLLCSLCNVGLGHFKDDPQILQSAIQYLT